MPEYTFSKSSIGDYKEKGSSFHAVAQPASGINDIKSKLFKIKEEYPDASHICYAYRITMESRMDEFESDAGEPNGSAGIPILNVIKRNQIINAIIFVIRYFGGSKLGIPGLIHAYGAAAEDATKNAKLKHWQKKKQLLLTYPYEFEGIMKSIMKKNQVEVIHEDFGGEINIQLEINVAFADKFIDTIKELSAGSAQVIMKE